MINGAYQRPIMEDIAHGKAHTRSEAYQQIPIPEYLYEDLNTSFIIHSLCYREHLLSV